MSPEEKLEIVLKRLDAEDVRCYDCETSGLDWKRNHIVGHVLSFGPDPKDSYYLPFRHAGTGNIGGQPGPTDPHGWDKKLHPGEKALMKKMQRQGTTNFGHNLGFDLKFLMGQMEFDPDGMRFEDTIINAPLIDEYMARFTLEYCAQVAGVFAKKGKIIKDYLMSKFPEATERNAMGYYYLLDADDPLTVEYAEGDGTSTWQLRDWQMPKIKEEDPDGHSLETVWDIESRLIPVLARMSVRGIRIDVERLETIEDETNKKIEKLLNTFPSGFNARSPKDVQNWMEKNGQTNWPMTAPSRTFPEGKPSFPEEFLVKSDAGQLVVDIRRLETLNSSFIQPMKDHHLFNGRVHSEYNQLRGDEYGTITGRLSSSNPNLQQVPKRNVELGRLFRSIFIPDEGKVWASVDYSQCEPRLLAYYSDARVLVDGYLASPSVDAHTSVTIATNDDWYEIDKTEQKARRETGKRVNQTIITGGGANALGHYGVENPRQVMQDFFRRMPEIKNLQKAAAATMKRRGYVKSLLRRRSRLPSRDKDYIAVNRLLQCGNADIIKIKMVLIDEYLSGTNRFVDLLNNVHDALDFQFPENRRDIYEECLDIMQSFGLDDEIYLPVKTADPEVAKRFGVQEAEPDGSWKVPLPMEVEAGEGPNWAIATYGEE